jgi:hypothetical protein
LEEGGFLNALKYYCNHFLLFLQSQFANDLTEIAISCTIIRITGFQLNGKAVAGGLMQRAWKFATLLVLPGALLAQSTYGTLLGTVKDATGAVVPGASVVVTEVATNISKSGAANERGDFEIPNLLPGTYEIAVSAGGFKRFVRRGVGLEPRAEVRVDATLEVGTTETTVEVLAAAPVITTETATVADVEKNQELSQLPINFRGRSTSPLNAITTLPGVQVDSGGPSFGISIAGTNPSQNEFSVDGFSVSSVRNNGPSFEMFPSTEQIAEIKITSELAPAEYGQVGDISFVGKGGSNQFHGSLFEYFQNDALDAIPAFANGKPKKRDNTFGGSVGGPVLIPKIYNGKNRTFFFFDWEGNRQRSAAPVTNNVPSSAMLGGGFLRLVWLLQQRGRVHRFQRQAARQPANRKSIRQQQDSVEPDQPRVAKSVEHVLSCRQPAERKSARHQQQLSSERSAAHYD